MSIYYSGRARGMLSGMARRAAKSVLAASQDELGSSSSNREEKETEQGEEAGTVSKGVSRQMSGPRKSGLAAAERSSALESSAEKETPSKRDGGKSSLTNTKCCYVRRALLVV